MAYMNLSFYQQEDGYSDGEIEKTMLHLVKSGANLQEIADDTQSYPILYHFSHLRENILNWYPFVHEASVLEIGAGCGAITGMLCDRLLHVTSVELTKSRADILFARHQHRENLEVVVGNFINMTFTKKFEYIVLNGVLEYAVSFIDSINPYVEFLTYVKSLLAPEGKVLIAIENRLGLKYLNGAREDHLGTFFSGINGYKEGDYVRTFSKAELDELLSQSGYVDLRYYYPYPDYKFPNEIFSDNSLLTMGYGKKYGVFDSPRAILFNEKTMNESLTQQGIVGAFTNSFLVEVSAEIFSDEQLYYIKLSNDRAEQYRICTIISQPNRGTMVEKVALSEGGQAHLQHMLQGSVMKTEKVVYLQGNISNGRISYPFLDDETLERRLVSLAQKRDKTAVFAELDRFFQAIGSEARIVADYGSPSFSEWFGQSRIHSSFACMRPANIDMVFDNVLLDGNVYKVLDCEWWCDFDVPVLFILWRALWNLYSTHTREFEFISFNSVLDYFSITQEMQDCFVQWTTHFSQEYVQYGRLMRHAQTEYPVSLQDVVARQMLAGCFQSHLYLGVGEGMAAVFTEKDAQEKWVDFEEDGSFHVCFSLGEELSFTALRWDPVENSLLACALVRIWGNDGRELTASAVPPFYNVEDWDVFFDTDPKYVIHGDLSRLTELHISGKIEFSLEKRLLQVDKAIESEMQKKDEAIDTLQIAKDQLQLAANQLQLAANQLQYENVHLREIIDDKEQLFQQATIRHEEIQKSLQANLIQMEDQKDSLSLMIDEMNQKPIRTFIYSLYKKLIHVKK